MAETGTAGAGAQVSTAEPARPAVAPTFLAPRDGGSGSGSDGGPGSGSDGGGRSAARFTPAHHAAVGTGSGRVVTGTAASVAVLGVLLTGAVLLGAGRVHGAPRTAALVAAGVAAVAVLIAAGLLLSRLVTGPPDGAASRSVVNRDAASREATGTGRGAGIAAAVAGAVLVVALGLTGFAAAVAVVGPTATDVPRLAMRTGRDADGRRTVRVDATVGGLRVGTPIAMSLTALGDGGTLLASTVQRSTGDASDTVRLAAPVADARTVQVDVHLTGQLCQAVLPVDTSVLATDVDVRCRRN